MGGVAPSAHLTAANLSCSLPAPPNEPFGLPQPSPPPKPHLQEILVQQPRAAAQRKRHRRRGPGRERRDAAAAGRQQRGGDQQAVLQVRILRHAGVAQRGGLLLLIGLMIPRGGGVRNMPRVNDASNAVIRSNQLATQRAEACSCEPQHRGTALGVNYIHIYPRHSWVKTRSEL